MAQFDPDVHHRRSVRLPGWDYAARGAYFITVCTGGEECALAEVVAGEARVTATGEAVLAQLEGLPSRFPGVRLDAHVVMPDHVHAIVWLAVGTHTEERGRTDAHNGATEGAIEGAIEGATEGAIEGAIEGAMNRAPTLGEAVRTFKAASARLARVVCPEFRWQRGYYEHIVRDDADLDRIRAYIANNPARWEERRP